VLIHLLFGDPTFEAVPCCTAVGAKDRH
jgi:hypothetical protein